PEQRGDVHCGTSYATPLVAATAPILPSERGYRLDDNDVGRSARLDMRKALELTVKSLENTR
ncbi:hypothetical protein, partial [Citrobacter sp. VF227]